MQRKYLLWSGSIVGIATLVACQSGVLTASADSEPSEAAASEAPSSERPIVAQRATPKAKTKTSAGTGSPASVMTESAGDVGFDVGQGDIAIDATTGYAIAAFPPTIPDRKWHKDAWNKDDCLSCHETGVAEAPMIRHRGLPEITFASKCRTCHVLIPGKTEMDGRYDLGSLYEDYAFPPMLPNNVNHAGAWNTDKCLMCHESGVRGAPVVEHTMIPLLAMKSNCRTCHVQVRSIDAEWMAR